MQEVRNKLKHLDAEVDRIIEFLDLPKLRDDIQKLEKEAASPAFWDDQKHATSVNKKMVHLQKIVETWEQLKKDVHELTELAQLINAEETPDEAEEARTQANELEKKVKKESTIVFFSGKHDQNGAMLMVHVGAGGVDAQDFAEMLMRMYMRYAEKCDWSVEVLEKSVGDEAGIKSALIRIDGMYAYGYLKHEMGVHRLVRLSPFNSKNTRETSFAKIEVTPDLGDDHGEIVIKKEDLKIDTFRASGHGGQSVNTTDSAVRITHLPTGIVVKCQNERSQLQNKEHAMKALKSKLVHLQEEQKAASIEELRGIKTETTWGHQLRSYVLHPYQMIKDHRTEFESSKTEAILDGDLDDMLEYNLEHLTKKQ